MTNTSDNIRREFERKIARGARFADFTLSEREIWLEEWIDQGFGSDRLGCQLPWGKPWLFCGDYSVRAGVNVGII